MKLANATTVAEYLDTHEYPPIFYNYPWLIRPLQWFTMFITLRNWYVLRRLREVCNRTQQGFSVLDAGCGLGDFSIHCARNYVGSRVMGLDFSESAVRLAKRISETMKLDNIVFIKEDLSYFHPKEQFDVILCNAVLQSIQDDERALQNLAEALKRGGELLLYTPVRYKRYIPFFDTLEGKYLDKFFYRYTNGFSHHRYSADDVVRKVLACGMGIERAELAYGLCGGIAFEIYSLFLILFKTLPTWLMFPVVPLYAVLVLPFQFLLMLIDYSMIHTRGNGLLLLARKK
ncbi:MAG TPA: class I SAM-dependent methyltransferase [Bacteroidota bacterium]|nr:class I SAM-dependent methyltransferase [Bacteroidota bacterium]